MRAILAYLTGGCIFFAVLYAVLPQGHADVFTQKTAFKTKPPYPFASYDLIHVNKKQIRNTTGLPVVELTMDPGDLFSFFEGIYTTGWTALTDTEFKGRDFKLQHKANWNNRGKDWRRPVEVNLFDAAGSWQAGFDGDCAINGNYTRDFPQKSLKIKFKNKVAQQNELLKNLHIKKELVLRNTGNDWGIAFCRDHLARQVIKQQKVVLQHSRLCVVYINNVFWGIYCLSNKADENYLADEYDCKKKSVHIIENGLLDYGTTTGLGFYREALAQVARIGPDDTLPQNLHFDVENMVTYLALQVYFCNTDFPNNNVICYTVEDPKKGEAVAYKGKSLSKLRFLFVDFDFAYGLGLPGNKFEYDMIAHIYRKKGGMSVAFGTLLKNKYFKALFKTEMQRLLETDLVAERQLACVAAVRGELQPNMDLQVSRWRKPFSTAEWESAMDEIALFMQRRGEVIYNQVIKNN